MKKYLFALLAVAAMVPATAAHAETLRVSGIYPAGSDEAVLVERIAVEEFGGPEGARLSFVLEDRLRDVSIGGEPWFTVLPPSLANEADGILQGYAEPRFSESTFRETREICTERDEDGDCIATREVEARCIQVNVSLAPEMRLVGYQGDVIWAGAFERNTSSRYCPRFDDKPDFTGTFESWLSDIANQARHALAPRYSVQDLRIMESRNGLDRALRDDFRAAVRMTDTDEAAACDMFETLFAASPETPSLIFNTGLCAEQRGDFALAEARYSLALGNDRSDDEGQEGLRRLDQRRHANRQLADREAFFSP